MHKWLWAAVLAAALTIRAAESEPVKLVDKPVTVTLAVPETARRGAPVLLQLQRVIAPKSTAVRFNVFAELPSADAGTSVDHPSFVGYVTLLPTGSAANSPPKGVTLQVADPAARLIRTKKTAQFTFVPTEKFVEGGVSIGSIRLE
jgi:hypothetical protein